LIELAASYIRGKNCLRGAMALSLINHNDSVQYRVCYWRRAAIDLNRRTWVRDDQILPIKDTTGANRVVASRDRDYRGGRCRLSVLNNRAGLARNRYT
jgi:hypothetical protein